MHCNTDLHLGCSCMLTLRGHVCTTVGCHTSAKSQAWSLAPSSSHCFCGKQKAKVNGRYTHILTLKGAACMPTTALLIVTVSSPCTKRVNAKHNTLHAHLFASCFCQLSLVPKQSSPRMPLVLVFLCLCSCHAQPSPHP